MKEYKVTIKPYLQKRVKPHIIKVYTDNNGEQFESYEGWPLYYQVIYKRKNTHIRSSFLRNNDKTLNHFSPDGGVFVNSSKMDSIIARETKVIESIIRFLENQDSDFDLSGFGAIYQYYAAGLHGMVNEKLKNYLQINLVFKLDSRIADFLNFDKGTYYSIYKYSDMLFGHLDLFETVDRERFELLKKFFELYGQKNETLPNHLKHHFEVPDNFFSDPLIIDFYNGRLRDELLQMGVVPKFADDLILEIGKVLNT
ncbi:MAG: hypothetical protein K9H64_21230 [Bacteroidales bacterium]|nr:hypothetical protein [Bacteroidales bacterium]MCF8458563.1 hypothetical protein [Bacteroidales bacterium]